MCALAEWWGKEIFTVLNYCVSLQLLFHFLPSYFLAFCPKLPLCSMQPTHGLWAKTNKPAACCLTGACKGSEGSSAGGDQEVTEGRDSVTQTHQLPQLASAFSRRSPSCFCFFSSHRHSNKSQYYYNLSDSQIILLDFNSTLLTMICLLYSPNKPIK